MNRVIQVRFQWTPDERQTAVKRTMRAHYESAFYREMHVLMSTASFLVMVSIAVSLFGVRDVTLSGVNLSLWLIGMIGLVAPSIWIRKRAASVANQMEWVQWSFTPEGISRRVETQAPAELLWRSVAECVRMPDGFVLRFRLGAKLAMQWLPLDGFGNREDAAAFSELAQCKVKTYRTYGMTTVSRNSPAH